MKYQGKGTVNRKTIHLVDDPGIPDGQRVNVTLECVTRSDECSADATREALRRAAGAWSDGIAGLDHYLEWNRNQRNGGRQEPAQ